MLLELMPAGGHLICFQPGACEPCTIRPGPVWGRVLFQRFVKHVECVTVEQGKGGFMKILPHYPRKEAMAEPHL